MSQKKKLKMEVRKELFFTKVLTFSLPFFSLFLVLAFTLVAFTLVSNVINGAGSDANASVNALELAFSQGEKKEISLETLGIMSSEGAKVVVQGIDFISVSEVKIIVDVPLAQKADSYFGRLVLPEKEIPLIVSISDRNALLKADLILQKDEIEISKRKAAASTNLNFYLDVKILVPLNKTFFTVSYEIKNLEGKVISEQKKQIDVSAEPLADSVNLPSSIGIGEYVLIVKVKSNDGKNGEDGVAISSEFFKVSERKFFSAQNYTNLFIVFLIFVGIIIFVLLLVTFYIRKNLDFIIKNQPKKLAQIYSSYIKNRKASEALEKLKKQSEILSRAYKLGVVNRKIYESSKSRIALVAQKIKKKFGVPKFAPKKRESRASKEVEGLIHELELLENAYKLRSVKRGHYKREKRRILKALNKNQRKL